MVEKDLASLYSSHDATQCTNNDNSTNKYMRKFVTSILDTMVEKIFQQHTNLGA